MFGTLVESGHFYDPVEKQVKETYLPQIIDQATTRAVQLAVARKLLDDVLKHTLRVAT